MKLLLLTSCYNTFNFSFPLQFYLLLGTRCCQVSGALPLGLHHFDGTTLALTNQTLRALLCPSDKHVADLCLLHSWKLKWESEKKGLVALAKITDRF